MRKSVTAVALVAMAVGVAACGGDDEKSGDDHVATDTGGATQGSFDLKTCLRNAGAKIATSPADYLFRCERRAGNRCGGRAT